MFSAPTNLYLTTGHMILQTVSIAKPPWAVFKLCCMGKGHYQSITGRGGATMKSNHFASENAPSCAKNQSPNISESTSEAPELFSFNSGNAFTITRATLHNLYF